MTDGWFLFLLLAGILTFGCTLLVYWVKNSLAQRQQDEMLTASDLRLMEDAVQSLIDRLKAASDEAVSAIAERQAALQVLLDKVDEHTPCYHDADAITRLAGDGVDDAEIAHLAGITRGEVELLLELQAARGEQTAGFRPPTA